MQPVLQAGSPDTPTSLPSAATPVGGFGLASGFAEALAQATTPAASAFALPGLRPAPAGADAPGGTGPGSGAAQGDAPLGRGGGPQPVRAGAVPGEVGVAANAAAIPLDPRTLSAIPSQPASARLPAATSVEAGLVEDAPASGESMGAATEVPGGSVVAEANTLAPHAQAVDGNGGASKLAAARPGSAHPAVAASAAGPRDQLVRERLAVGVARGGISAGVSNGGAGATQGAAVVGDDGARSPAGVVEVTRPAADAAASAARPPGTNDAAVPASVPAASLEVAGRAAAGGPANAVPEDDAPRNDDEDRTERTVPSLADGLAASLSAAALIAGAGGVPPAAFVSPLTVGPSRQRATLPPRSSQRREAGSRRRSRSLGSLRRQTHRRAGHRLVHQCRTWPRRLGSNLRLSL